MRLAFAGLLVVHGAIHLIGFIKAFGLAPVPQLTSAIGRPAGVLWLAAALAFLATAALLFVWPERWWVVAVVAVVASQAAIFGSWVDARFGTFANLVVLVPVALALADLRSGSFRSIYRREVERGLARQRSGALVTEADLASLPAPLQTYLRRTGAVGRPRVRNFQARWRGQMRSGADAPWMEIQAEQVEFFDEPTRLFYMTASRGGVPFEALHVYEGAAATMRVRVASVFDVVDARGPEMNRSETVTLFNDMCLLAPASLLDASVTWRSMDDRRVRGTFTNAGNTISAELSFDETGDLVDFVSYDRLQSADGKSFRSLPWSTPVREHRDFGPARVAARGDAVWHEADKGLVYARFELQSLVFNVGAHRDEGVSEARLNDRARTPIEGPR
jgi:hypothetical protein